MNTKKIFGEISKAFIVPFLEDFAIYAFSSKYKKVVNTHMFPSLVDAKLTRNEINRK